MSKDWKDLFETASENPSVEGVIDVAPQEVWNKRDQLVLIDVREEGEYVGELGHVPGTKLIVMGSVPQRLQEIPKDKTVVLICRSGGRSGQVSGYLKQNGYENVFNMKGGMLMWNQLMLPKN